MSGKEVPLTFEDFNSFINSLYSVALQREYLSHRSNRLIEMVFGHLEDFESQEGATRLQALRAANCLKVLGKGVIRVVHRVEEARESCKLGAQMKVVARCELAIGGAPSPEKEIPEELEQNQDSSPSANSGTKTRPESENEAGLSSASSATSLTQHEGRKGVLDLSNCQLMQVPDAVYYMLRNTPLIECNLAFNVISKIPPKLPAKFSFIKKLNLSHNRLSTLPDELRELTQLEMVDISNNSFLSLPPCLFATPKLREIRALKNFITDVDAETVSSAPKLAVLNLKENPLSRSTEESLSKISRINIILTKRELEEWEDLTV